MWSDQDRIDALVWQAEEDDRLPCGHAREALLPENEEAYEVTRLVCHACKATFDNVDRLIEPSAARYMLFVPRLEVTDG